MFKLSDVTSAVASQLQAESDVTSKLQVPIVELGTHLNMDADRAPWCGVFRNSTNYQPRCLGGAWTLDAKILIVCQAVDYRSGENCRSTLKALVLSVINTIVSDETLNNTVDIIKNINVEYAYKEDEREEVHFQTALINLDLEAVDQ